MNNLISKNTLEINTGFWIIVHLLNLYFVSRLGIEAIATVAIGGTAFMLLMVPIMGLVTAIYGMIGSFNREDKAGLARLAKQILSTNLLISIILAILGWFFAPALLCLLGAAPDVTFLAVTYFRICAVWLVVTSFLWPINGMIRSTRDMFQPMLLMALMFSVQLFLAYALILGNLGFPRLEVTGAALSTTISGAVGSIVGLWMLVKGKLFRELLIKVNLKNWKEFKIQFKTLKEIINIAGFDTLEGIIRMSAGMIMLWIIAPFGTFALAAYHIGQQLFRYCAMPGIDLGMTTAIGVSNNLSAKDLKRAEKWGWISCGMNVLFMALIGAGFYFFADQLIGFFRQEPEILEIGASYLKITVFGYAFFAVGIILRRAFAGAKDTRTPSLVYLATMGLQIALALVLSRVWGLGVFGIWWAILAASIFNGLVLAVLFKKGHWKRLVDADTAQSNMEADF